MKRIWILTAIAATVVASACSKSADTAGEEDNTVESAVESGEEAAAEAPPATADEPTPTAASPVTTDIMNREPVAQRTMVQHVLISWSDKAPVYAGRGGQDPRGAARSAEEANGLAAFILAQARGGRDFVAMMREFSEDPGSARTGRAYEVTPQAGLVPPFKALGMRLNVSEIGVCETDFGFHIIKRTE